MSIYMMFFLGTTPIGAPIIGWVSDQWGQRTGIAAGGAAAIVSALVAGVWIRRHWHVDLAYSSSRPFLSTVGPRERAARAHTDAVPPDGAASESPFASPD